MRISRASGGIAWVIVVLAAGAMAQEPGPQVGRVMEPLTEIRRIVLKRYARLAPVAVWEAAERGVGLDVRFSDSFNGAGRARGALRTVRLGKRYYRIGALFGTENALTCLVPANQTDTLKKVAGFHRGQEITVEGTIVGAIGERRCVLVDRVLTGHDAKSVIEHELILGWAEEGGVAHKKIVKPGEYTVEIPCRNRKGQSVTAAVLVEQFPREWFLKQMERRGAAGEDMWEGPPKRYDRYSPEAVYRHAADGALRHVRFEDRVKGRAPGFPRTVRLPGRRLIRIGRAFDTYTGLTCLMRARDHAAMQLARRLVPGQDVEVKGTILPPAGGYKIVLVDELVLPGATGPTESPEIWVVTVFWGEEEPRMFYEVGRYLLDFPCRFVEGRTERLTAELREVRVIKGRRRTPAPGKEELKPQEKPEGTGESD